MRKRLEKIAREKIVKVAKVASSVADSRIVKVGSLVAGSVVMGVGLYYSMSYVTGAGLMMITYPVSAYITGPLVDSHHNHKKE